MPRVDKYMLLHHTSCRDLQRVVQDAIDNGYEPLGTPFNYVELTEDCPVNVFCQAVIKLVKEQS